jgi:HNH endonuclease
VVRPAAPSAAPARATPTEQAEPAAAMPLIPPTERPLPEPPPPVAAAPSARAVVNPLRPERYKLQLTIDEETLAELELARDLFRHTDRAGDDAALVKRALQCLVAELKKKKFAVTEGTETSRTEREPAADEGRPSRYIPAAVRQAVYLRDGGRCAYIAAGGRRCNERAGVEIHHIRPYAHDGPATIDNLSLRCRSHNNYEWWRLSTELRLMELGMTEREASQGNLDDPRAEDAFPGSRWGESARPGPS